MIDFASQELPGPELHAALAKLRSEHGPVAPTHFLGRPAWILLGHATLAAAFRDGERFPPQEIYRRGIEPLIGRNFQTMEEGEHRLHRRIATPAFRPRVVGRYERSGFADLAHELIDRFASEQQVDLARVFTRLYPFIVITRLLGIPREAEERFHGWAQGMLHFMRDAEHARRCSRAFGEYLAPIVEQRSRQPGDDVISALIHSEVDGVSLGREELLSTIRLLFAAGATTTHDALGNLVYALLGEREWERVREDAKLREPAVDELLRWEPPVAVLPRTSDAQGIEVEGVAIPGGAIVLFAIAAANRDPAVFASPDAFRPGREETQAMLTFGPGLRQCPGQHLARRQTQIVLDVLLERLPELALRDATAAQPRGTAIRGPQSLPVTLRS